MKNYDNLNAYSKDDLIRLIEIYSKNWLAMDGVWFQSVEQKLGMDEAMFHDGEAWWRFTVIEAKRIKEFLKLVENPGLEGLKKALGLRFYANINEDKIDICGNTLTYSTVHCPGANSPGTEKYAVSPLQGSGNLLNIQNLLR